MPRQSHKRSLADRFWPRVEKSDGCWLWTGTRNRKGYGYVSDRRTMRIAHRVAWELVNGPIPDGLFVLHRCDNPPCVNPAHLFLGTNADNMRDMLRKGRSTPPRGWKDGLCQRGHRITEENIVVRGGRRYCKTCRRASDAARWARQCEARKQKRRQAVRA